MRSKPTVTALLCLLLLVINVFVVAKLFAVRYLAYNGSVEGTFIAISRIMAKYPGQWSWWPFWSCGMPFETSYLPFSHWMVAAFLLLTHGQAAHAFHEVIAAVYAGSALSVFWMALVLSRKLTASFIAALGYSCFSFANLLVPAIRADAGGLWNLRRLQVLVYWGESPHTVALALLPVAMVCFHYALTTRAVKWKILAGVAAAAVVLSNAFGIAALGMALLCWLLAFRARPWWKASLAVAAIGAVSYCWVSPWLSPTMIHAIRISAPTAGGDYRYRADSYLALGAIVASLLLLSWAMRRLRAPEHVQFFVLFGHTQTAIVLTWYLWRVAVIPQPGRYQVEMDLALMLAVVFAGAAILDRFPKAVRRAVAAVVLLGLAVQVFHAASYARTLIRSADPSQLAEYKIAKWMDQNRHGQRAFLGGSSSLLYNAITDNPQVKGSHDQHAVNPFMAIVAYTIYSDQNAGDRGAEYSIFWLKAFGAQAISVAGPDSNDYYKPFVHPRKFEGVLPAIWRDGDNTIYEVPGRSTSLAHVIPASAVVARTPIHGLDTAPAQAYVAALDDARYPLAGFGWASMSEARIRADVAPGQVVAVQVTYVPGWEAWANGRRQRMRGDGLGLIVIDPDFSGPGEIALRYTGGVERLMTRGMSLAASLFAFGFAVRRRWRSP
ncbi:MAG: hypothetical protein P4L56_19910 [Candidatus Sulfopaludibacter sp.]|nr:hypothetical protein [Candidatus Sulfopaludibacter sp.]